MHANTAEAETAVTTSTDTSTTETTADLNENLSLLESLMAQIETLKKKLLELTGQVSEVKAQIRADLSEGATGDDVEKIQALLASDPALYPQGLKTGFFGPLTREALKRFQLRHELEVTGTIDEATKALLEEYLADAGNAGIPPGFLRAPGMQMKIEMRFSEDCESSGHGKGAFCNKLKIKYEHDDDVIDGSGDATEAIADAEAVIAALEAAIDVSEEDADAIEAATDALSAAETKLTEAQAKLAADDFDTAEDYADEAEELAGDAYEELVGEEFDNEDESEDENEDDEDESEDEDEEEEDEDDTDTV